jgi:hypothetical protein
MRKITLWVIGILLLSGTTFALAESIVRIAPLTYSIKSNTTTVTTSATAIPATALVGRESITIRNIDSGTTTVYVGGSDVTTANGYPLDSANPAISIDIDDSVVIYGIVSAGTASVRSLEAK